MYKSYSDINTNNRYGRNNNCNIYNNHIRKIKDIPLNEITLLLDTASRKLHRFLKHTSMKYVNERIIDTNKDNNSYYKVLDITTKFSTYGDNKPRYKMIIYANNFINKYSNNLENEIGLILKEELIMFLYIVYEMKKIERIKTTIFENKSVLRLALCLTAADTYGFETCLNPKKLGFNSGLDYYDYYFLLMNLIDNNISFVNCNNNEIINDTTNGKYFSNNEDINDKSNSDSELSNHDSESIKNNIENHSNNISTEKSNSNSNSKVSNNSDDLNKTSSDTMNKNNTSVEIGNNFNKNSEVNLNSIINKDKNNNTNLNNSSNSSNLSPASYQNKYSEIIAESNKIDEYSTADGCNKYDSSDSDNKNGRKSNLNSNSNNNFNKESLIIEALKRGLHYKGIRSSDMNKMIFELLSDESNDELNSYKNKINVNSFDLNYHNKCNPEHLKILKAIERDIINIESQPKITPRHKEKSYFKHSWKTEDRSEFGNIVYQGNVVKNSGFNLKFDSPPIIFFDFSGSTYKINSELMSIESHFHKEGYICVNYNTHVLDIINPFDCFACCQESNGGTDTFKSIAEYYASINNKMEICNSQFYLNDVINSKLSLEGKESKEDGDLNEKSDSISFCIDGNNCIVNVNKEKFKEMFDINSLKKRPIYVITDGDEEHEEIFKHYNNLTFYNIGYVFKKNDSLEKYYKCKNEPLYEFTVIKETYNKINKSISSYKLKNGGFLKI